MPSLLLEQAIVSAIEGAFANAGIVGVLVRGAWAAASPGEIRASESAAEPAFLVVAVSQPATDDYGTGGPLDVTFTVALRFEVRRELDPAGALLASVSAALTSLILRWVSLVDSSQDEHLTVEGFEPGGVRALGGDPPSAPPASSTWSSSWAFAVRGTLRVSV